MQVATSAVPRPEWWTAADDYAAAMAASVAGDEFAAAAYVSQDRWVVMCPDCGSAQVACYSDRRFMCVECANVAIGGYWRPVVWPDDAAGIAAELDRRDDPRTRNWLPGETVTFLAAERAINEDQSEPVDWGGHTHTWPKQPTADGWLTCRECALTLPADTVRGG